MSVAKKIGWVALSAVILSGSGCGLQSRRDLNVANPQGSAGLMNFTQAVTSLEAMTGVDGDSVGSLRSYKNIAIAFLSAEGDVLSLTPTYLLVSIGIVGGYCNQGVNAAVDSDPLSRVFLKESLLGLGPAPAPVLDDLTASRVSAIAADLSNACLERGLSSEELGIITGFVAEAKAAATASPAAEFKRVVAQMCTLVCASFDALRF
ncbi:MAG: hypothetical protein KDD51_13925 [Bdellovibrionales bacterium]|nr:hypothetical protein [Bdellovibrionales bacterium]